MSWRAIQDTVAASESLAGLSHGAERLYWRILAATDPHGRLPGGVAKVRARCLPLVKVRDAEIERWLGELEDAKRVVLYTVKGHTYIQVCEFEENQPTEFLRRRGDSKYPDPPKTLRFAGDSRTTPEDSRTTPDYSALEGEGEGLNVPNGTSSQTAALRAVYDHWRRARGKTNRRYDTISEGRRQKIKARLRDYPADELKRAIDAVALDPWEERPRHDDLTVIFRSREQVEKFLALSEDTARMTPAERLRTRMAEKGIS